MARVETWRSAWPDVLIRSRFAFELLLDRRVWLFVTADLVLVVQGLFSALLGGGQVEGLYTSMCVVPMVLLGVPVLSSSVALERRAGSLDLALAVHSTEGYFLRRVSPVCGVLVLQAWCLTIVAYVVVLEDRLFAHLLSPKGFFLLPVALHAALVGLLIGAVTLFWASRLSSTGGTMVASFVTIAALYKWVFASPVLSGLGSPSTWVGGVLPPLLLAVVWNITVLALATVLFYLYARQRLRRPEVMLP